MKLNKILIFMLTATLLSVNIGCFKSNQKDTESDSKHIKSQDPLRNENSNSKNNVEIKLSYAKLLLSFRDINPNLREALFKKYIENHYQKRALSKISQDPNDLLEGDDKDSSSHLDSIDPYADPYSTPTQPHSDSYSSTPTQPHSDSYSGSQNSAGNLNNSQSNNSKSKDMPSQLAERCNNLSINAIYESALSKNILFNNSLKKQMSTVLRKVIAGIKTTMGANEFENSFRTWAEYTDPSSEFPVAQKLKIAADLLPRHSDRTAALKFAIESRNNPNPALQLDYIAFNAKSKDHIGIPSLFLEQRDYFFNAIVRRLRGYRGNKPQATDRYQYGIAPFDVPFLEMEKTENSYPWRHWGRDSCVNKPDSSLYARAVTERDIPLTCGISGTTNLFIWSVFAYKVELTREETLLLLLSIWSTLCADGGHSLQEVLTSSKLITSYMKNLVLSNETIKDQISLQTLENLVEVTNDIQAIPQPKSTNRNPIDLAQLKVIVQDKIYSKTYSTIQLLKGSEVPDETPDLQRELEAYFSNDNEEKEFGTYWSSFFRKFQQNTAFQKERSRSQKELESYAHENCSAVLNQSAR